MFNYRANIPLTLSPIHSANTAKRTDDEKQKLKDVSDRIRDLNLTAHQVQEEKEVVARRRVINEWFIVLGAATYDK